jgi:hypothetical protein
MADLGLQDAWLRNRVSLSWQKIDRAGSLLCWLLAGALTSALPSGSKGEKAVINWNEINRAVITVNIVLIDQQDFS